MADTVGKSIAKDDFVKDMVHLTDVLRREQAKGSVIFDDRSWAGSCERAAFEAALGSLYDQITPGQAYNMRIYMDELVKTAQKCAELKKVVNDRITKCDIVIRLDRDGHIVALPAKPRWWVKSGS